jgi:hypothetical protein
VPRSASEAKKHHSGRDNEFSKEFLSYPTQAMAFLFSKKQTTPEKVPTDEVIPLHYWDDNEVFRSIIVDFALRFDDVLDHEMLRRALARLMEIGDWRKLGARLRIKVLPL